MHWENQKYYVLMSLELTGIFKLCSGTIVLSWANILKNHWSKKWTQELKNKGDVYWSVYLTHFVPMSPIFVMLPIFWNACEMVQLKHWLNPEFYFQMLFKELIITHLFLAFFRKYTEKNTKDNVNKTH